MSFFKSLSNKPEAKTSTKITYFLVFYIVYDSLGRIKISSTHDIAVKGLHLNYNEAIDIIDQFLYDEKYNLKEEDTISITNFKTVSKGQFEHFYKNLNDVKD